MKEQPCYYALLEGSFPSKSCLRVHSSMKAEPLFVTLYELAIRVSTSELKVKVIVWEQIACGVRLFHDWVYS